MESRMIERSNIEKFCRGKATNFLAEVFFRELQFVSGEPLIDNLIVINHGMNSRIRSRDVLKVQKKDVHSGSSHEKTVLHLSRNGIYQQLPEFLFHPISISSPSMSNKEVVEAIRENKKKEREAIRFFSLFETEIFKESVHIFERHLSMFDNPYKNSILQKISAIFFPPQTFLTDGERYRLFLFLCQSESLKENIPELEKVVYTVMRQRVSLRYKQHSIDNLPYEVLGDCHLGSDSGLEGPIVSELDDVEVKIIFDKTINEHTLKEKMKSIKFILSFFLLSSRHIDVIYTNTTNFELILGQNYLGYDTNL